MILSFDKRVLKGSLLLLAALIVTLLLQVYSASCFLALLILFHFNFFRDPKPLTVKPHQILSPGQGVVVDINEVDEPRYLKGRAVRIGVFLSVFDVHVNRAPIAGTIEYLSYEPGKFFNAMKPECSRENESLWMGIGNSSSRLLVRAISGAIARRICRDVNEKDHVTQGQKLGIICYGSRVEIFVPKDSFKMNVQLGQKVKVGHTLLGEWA